LFLSFKKLNVRKKTVERGKTIFGNPGLAGIIEGSFTIATVYKFNKTGN